MNTFKCHHFFVSVILASLFVAALPLRASDDEFNRLAKGLCAPAVSAAAFVNVIEQQLISSGQRMSDGCRKELMAVMTKASVERLQKTGPLAERAQVLTQYFNSTEAREISDFLESDVGPRMQIAISRISLGLEKSKQDQKSMLDSTFSPEEQKRVFGFLQSATGQLFQRQATAINAEFLKLDAKYEKETMEVLNGYAAQISAIMQKNGY